MRFAFYTLGCKTNQYETQAMEQLLTELGHEIGQFDQPCDGYIINTCSVTAVADKKNRAVIRRCRRDNPDAVIGVCDLPWRAKSGRNSWTTLCAAGSLKSSLPVDWRNVPAPC